MEGISDNVSYLQPRVPSLYFGKRYFEAGKTNLLSRFEHGGQHSHISRNEKVKVYLRIKPSKDAAQMLAPPQDETFQVKDSQTLVLRSLKDRAVHKFKFTKVFGGNASQEHVYNDCVHELVKDFIGGQNCLLFAYGTSSAGKTYTIQGTSKEPGIIPRAINVLFNSIRGQQTETCGIKPDMVTRVVELDDKTMKQEILYKQQIMAWSLNKNHVFDSKISGTSSEKAPDNTTSSINNQAISVSFRDMQEQLNNSLLVNTDGKGPFSTWVSFAEVYNENVYDLLEPTGSGRHKRQNLALGVDSKGQVYIKGLKHICVNSAEEAYHIMLYGQHNLRVAATGLNTLSSRSHCIFTMKLLQHLVSEHQKSVRISTFSFCDLAGAESAKKTHNVGERLKESQNINTSLLVLGRCLMAIRDNQMNKSENLVPFRDSKLTRLFQRAMTGRESLAMIVNMNPSPLLREETLNVLTFSAVAKQLISVPARHKKRVPRSSSFFQYVSKSSTLVSSGTFEGDSATSYSNNTDNQHLRSQIEALVNEIGELKKQLTMERNSKLAREIEVRREVCDYFSDLRSREQAECKSLLEGIQLQYEQMSDWRLKKLEDYYQNQQKRKRPCHEDSSEDGDSTLQDSDASVVPCLTEKLRAANELLDASQKDYNDLQKKYSTLMFELSWCKTQLKNAEKLKEAAQALCEGDQTQLTSELERQLAAANEELCKKEEKNQELNGILKDAVVDYKQLVDDMKAAEKERDDLDLKLAEKDCELQQKQDALKNQQQELDKQLHSLDVKDERIKILEKQLLELQAKYDNDIGTAKLQTQELEAEQKTLLKDKQLLTSEAEELKNKFQESEEKLQQREDLQRIHQEEMQKLMCVIGDLQDKLSALKEANNNNVKEKIDAQNCAEELRKHLEERTATSQKEVSELRAQLKKLMANEEFARLQKEELEEKSKKCDKLESENESLRRSLEIKEIEQARFKENRDQLLKTYENRLKDGKEEIERLKRENDGYKPKFLKNTPPPQRSQCEEKKWKLNEDDLAKMMKPCCVTLPKVGEMQEKCDKHDETRVSLFSESSQTTRQSRRRHSRVKTADENTNPSTLGSLDIKHTLNTQPKRSESKTSKFCTADSNFLRPSSSKRGVCNERSKSRSRRKQLFACNLDVSSEITPVETEEITNRLSPARILRCRRTLLEDRNANK